MDRPILFTGDMVRAILDGRKTQTRRVVKNQIPTDCHYHGADGHDGEHYFSSLTREEIDKEFCGQHTWRRCPYGKPGDRLWVRETWQYDDWTPDGYPYIKYRADGQCLLLEVTGVRVERVQEITRDGCFAEGVGIPNSCEAMEDWEIIGQFGELWDSINAKRGYGWDVNPWVWVVEFKLATKKKEG